MLSFSRFANQAIVLISPMLLVRLLSIREYGGYREFMLYAALVGTIAALGIPHSMAYFLPKHPEREQVWVTQTTLFTLASSSLALIGIYLAGDLIRANTSFDFVVALQLYMLFLINFNYLEFYWLGKKRTDYVLYYSTGRLLARILVAITVAVITRSAYAIVLSLVVVEAVRCALILWYGVRRRWFTRTMSRASLALQASYFLPLGGGAIVEVVNDRIGMLFISTMLGAEALAFFVIGTFASQIVHVFRSAIADVIFPEIVELKHAKPRDTLPLWQRATVWYCILIFPAAIIFSYYADAAVTVLFTSEYAAAIPVFAVYSLAMVLDCFDFHLPIRAQNANRYFIAGNTIALVANTALLYPTYAAFGLIGPAVAFFVSRMLFTLYLGHQALRLYHVSWAEIVKWRDLAKILSAAVLCVPILIVGKYTVDSLFIRAIVFCGTYVVGYAAVLRMLGVWDAFAFVRALIRSAQKAPQ